MAISEIIVFVLSCIIFYIIGNSFLKFIGKVIKKIKAKRQPKAFESVTVAEAVKVGEVNESNC